MLDVNDTGVGAYQTPQDIKDPVPVVIGSIQFGIAGMPPTPTKTLRMSVSEPDGGYPVHPQAQLEGSAGGDR